MDPGLWDVELRRWRAHGAPAAHARADRRPAEVQWSHGRGARRQQAVDSRPDTVACEHAAWGVERAAGGRPDATVAARPLRRARADRQRRHERALVPSHPEPDPVLIVTLKPERESA